jgi:hypothetical protein
LIITLVFEKNANFFAENWEKSQKIVVITSTPGWQVKVILNSNPLGEILIVGRKKTVISHSRGQQGSMLI